MAKCTKLTKLAILSLICALLIVSAGLVLIFNKGQFVPTCSVDNISKIIKEYFSEPRDYLDRQRFVRVTTRLEKYLDDIGLNTTVQSFYLPREYGRRLEGRNIIGRWDGAHSGTASDQIVVIGGHYDTVYYSPGVDDNGSGCAAVMELARLVTKHQCKFNRTLMFVFFDMEENGLKGSQEFVTEYLIKKEIDENNASVIGAYIMDMILSYDPNPYTQLTYEFKYVLPNWTAWVERNDHRSDFAAVWARKDFDTHLFDALQRNWLNKDKYKLSLMAGSMPQYAKELVNPRKFYNDYILSRSDHGSLWYPIGRQNLTFPAVLIHDLGPWRQKTRFAYHNQYDDTDHLTDENLAFAKNIIDSLIKTLLELADGKCSA